MNTNKIMSKKTSLSHQVAIKTFTAAFQILKDAGGSLLRKEMITKMTSAIKFTKWENAHYEKSKTPRWKKIFSLYTSPIVKAGFLQNNKGTWILTAEGKTALNNGAVEMIHMALASDKVLKSTKKEGNLFIPNPELSEIENEIGRLINEHRIALGLIPLTFNAAIAAIARVHSLAMAVSSVPFGHSGFQERTNEAKQVIHKGSGGSAENIAGHFRKASEVVNAWLDDPGYKRNLDP